jgi:hypothetical protein
MTAFRQAAEDAGRDPDSLEVSVYACPPNAELVNRCAGAGISRMVFRLPTEGSDGVLRFLDRLGELKALAQSP